VQYASATGTAWQVMNLTNVTLQPGQYYLVAQGSGPNGVNNIPTPDATGSGAMSATAAKIALVSATAAGVTVEGRVASYSGIGISNATFTLTDSQIQIRTARSNQFGYYGFADVTAGEAYVISARHKSYIFSPTVINVADSIISLDLYANGSQ